MITKISKSYTRLVNLGNYENVKVGLTIEKEVNAELTSKQIKELSNKLLAVAEKTVKEEAKKIKEKEKTLDK